MVDASESVSETKAEDIKYTLTNPKYKFYARYWEDLVSYIIINIYVVVERFIIAVRPLQFIIGIQGIDFCFMMKKITNRILQKHFSLKHLTEMNQN